MANGRRNGTPSRAPWAVRRRDPWDADTSSCRVEPVWGDWPCPTCCRERPCWPRNLPAAHWPPSPPTWRPRPSPASSSSWAGVPATWTPSTPNCDSPGTTERLPAADRTNPKTPSSSISAVPSGSANGGRAASRSPSFSSSGRVVDEMSVVRSLYTDSDNHTAGSLLMNLGRPMPGSPSLGSWMVYGLGNREPGFACLCGPARTTASSTAPRIGPTDICRPFIKAPC